jgi:hypothetical protein
MLLPIINDPTDSFNVWEHSKIDIYKDKVAVYIFWDEKGFKNPDRYKYYLYPFQELDHFPIYVGKTYDLGKRIVEHLTGDKYTKNYSTYFYGIDVYVFEDLDETHLVRQAQKIDDFKFESLADLYETYFIMRFIPWFNDTSNIYSAKKGVTHLYFENDYYKQRRSVWSAYPSIVQKVRDGFIKIEQIANQWRGVNDEKTVQIERWLKVEDFVDELIKRRSDQNKAKLRQPLIDYINNGISNDNFFMDTVKKKKFIYYKGSGGLYEIASDALLYFKLPKDLVDNLLKGV